MKEQNIFADVDLCALCGVRLSAIHQNNASPAAEGVCCTVCNDAIVIPLRIKGLMVSLGREEK
jgi:hypothetical protein